MLIFALNQYNNLAEELVRKIKSVWRFHRQVAVKPPSRWKIGHFEARRFNNRELQIILKTKVKNRHVLVIGATMPPDSNFFQTLLLIDTLKKEGAGNIKILLPYLAYSRQDHPGPNESRAFAWVGEMLKSAGANSVATLDIHDPKVIKDFVLPLKSISIVPLFVEIIKKDLKGEFKKLILKGVRGLTSAIQADFSIVAPDDGALDICRQVREKLNLKDKVVYFKKIRKPSGVSVSVPYGKLKEKAVLIDDMIDTGETLVKCSAKLKAFGVKEIYIFVTHGLFTGTKWRKLFSFRVKRIYCTDSIGSIIAKHSRIKIISIKNLLTDFFKNF